MAKNTVPIIIGAVLFGLLAIGLTLYSLMGGGGPSNNTAPVANTAAAATPATSGRAMVARRAIYPRTIITSEMLTEGPEGSAGRTGAVTNSDLIIGHLANRTIQAGQIVTGDSLTNGLGRVIPANIAIPAGLRGVAVWVDDAQTAAGLVDIGDRVDVIATHDVTVEKIGNTAIIGSAAVTAGRTIGQDLEVLAVDRSIREARPATTPGAAPAQPGAAPADPNAPAAGATPAPGQPQAVNQPAPAQGAPAGASRTRVILAAPPDIAQRLIAANVKGQLHLTIRNPNAHERFVQAEAREYPSRLVAGPPVPRPATPRTNATPTPGNNSGGGNRPIGREYQTPIGPPFVDPSIRPADPNGMKDTTIIMPAPAPEKEVTVIRGTEKTRVVVPR